MSNSAACDTADAADKLDDKLKKIKFVRMNVFRDIENHQCIIDREEVCSADSARRLKAARDYVDEKKALLAAARATLLEIDDIAICGKLVTDDLNTLDYLYRVKDGSVPPAVYRWKFRQCRNHFISIYNGDHASNKGYAIWVTDGDKVHRLDLTWKGSVWRDASGAELRKWGGYSIADPGVLIARSHIAKLNYTQPALRCFDLISSWVSYRLDDGAAPDAAASAAAHSDKKRRADDD